MARLPVVDTTDRAASGTNLTSPGHRDASDGPQLLLHRPGHRRARRRTPIPGTRSRSRSPCTARPARRTRSSSTASTRPASNTAFQGKELNYEFIQEIDVKTGRIRGGVRPLDRRHDQRDHQVGGPTSFTATSSATRPRLARSLEPGAGRLDGRNGERIHEGGLRRGSRRLFLEGPGLVLRGLRPRAQHDRQARAVRAATWSQSSRTATGTSGSGKLTFGCPTAIPWWPPSFRTPARTRAPSTTPTTP